MCYRSPDYLKVQITIVRTCVCVCVWVCVDNVFVLSFALSSLSAHSM